MEQQQQWQTEEQRRWWWCRGAGLVWGRKRGERVAASQKDGRQGRGRKARGAGRETRREKRGIERGEQARDKTSWIQPARCPPSPHTPGGTLARPRANTPRTSTLCARTTRSSHRPARLHPRARSHFPSAGAPCCLGGSHVMLAAVRGLGLRAARRPAPAECSKVACGRARSSQAPGREPLLSVGPVRALSRQPIISHRRALSLPRSA